MKKILFSSAILLFLANFTDNLGNNILIKNDNSIQNIQIKASNYKLPENVSFCNERIPTEISRIKENLEREFYLLLDREGQLVLYLKRAGRYFPLIENKLIEAGMPSDLKFIAIAESALLNLVSIKGAGGYWQFMDHTAKRMGLKINEYIDERYDIKKSTDAAIKYLKKLYGIFKNWALAVAAYNVGPENISDNLNFQWENNYYNLFLNEETSRFIFRIAAIKIILSDYKKYGINLDEKDFYKPYETKTIFVDDEIRNLAFWAKTNGTSYLEVKTLNPWILGRSLPDGKYEIVIPKYANSKDINLENYKYEVKKPQHQKVRKKVTKKNRK